MSLGPAFPFTNRFKVSAKYYIAFNSMVVPLQSHIWRWNRQAQESQWSSLLGNNDHLTKVHIWRQGLWAVMMMWLLVGWWGWRRCNNGDICDTNNGDIFDKRRIQYGVLLKRTALRRIQHWQSNGIMWCGWGWGQFQFSQFVFWSKITFENWSTQKPKLFDFRGVNHHTSIIV